MTFAREKRLLLGWLALLAPLPLPFNQAIEWWLLLLYTLALAYFLQRADRGAERWLPNWALNALGVAYLPILFFDVQRAMMRSSFLEPLLHLLLFLVAVKLYSLRREREKWQLMVSIFFLFTGAMATSSHLAVSLYLLLFVALAMAVLARFAHLYLLADVGQDVRAPASAVSLRAPLAAAVLLTVAVAAPLFAAMPRFRDPFVFGQGGGQPVRIGGFSDSVDLSLTSAIRGNRSVVMRVRLARGQAPKEWRFKAGTYERYLDQRWLRQGRRGEVVPPAAGRRRFRLTRVITEVSAELELFLEPISSASLVLPLETLWIDGLDVPALYRDAGGAISLPLVPRDTVGYRVATGADPLIVADTRPDGLAAALDDSAVTPRMRALAREVMGEGPDGERIARLERYLLRNHAYTLDYVGLLEDDPLESFLFATRRGHCELFASSMVLLLRAEGVPARLVAGFLDAELNPLQDYFIVRQSNAHAWVEAYDPEGGWRAYDPTPPEGRPSAESWSMRLGMSQLYDFLIFRWDRYVLSFNADDQAGVIERLRTAAGDLWQRMLSWLRGEDEPEGTVPADTVSERLLEPSPTAPPAIGRVSWPLLLLAPAIAAALALFLLWRRRMPATAQLAYRRLRVALTRSGQRLSAATPPLAIARLTAERYPPAAAPARRLIALYLEESFAGRALGRAERRQLAEALGEAVRAVRAGAGSRPAASGPTRLA